MTWLARALRVIAIAIAVAGIVDPVLTWPQRDKPIVALVDVGDAGATAEIARGLAQSFDVHRGPIAGALGTVLVGTSLPPDPPAVAGVVVAALPKPAALRVEISRIGVPVVAAPASRIPVGVTVRARGASGRTLRVDVSANGVVLDRETTLVPSDDAVIHVSLSAAAASVGLTRLVVRVRDDAGSGGPVMAEAVAATTVRADRWNVLVVDARPSWMSTFVRRVLEADRRFVVSSRVTTSRDIAAESGHVPALSDAAFLESFSTVIVGAPDALSSADVRALERFARDRGGAIVLLMDRVDRGAFASLTGAASWRDVHSVERRTLASPAGALVATELASAVGLASGAEILASGPTVDGAATPAVWQVPLGAGRVVVSGALDAWRYRTREQNGFSKFFAQVIGDAAAAAPDSVAVVPTSSVVPPGASVDVRVIVRSVQLSDPSRPAPTVDVRATVAGSTPSDAEPIRLWPTPERGVFAASVRVPSTKGTSRVTADAARGDGGAIGSASADVLVGETSVVTPPEDLAAWVTSRGGVVVQNADAIGVTSALQARQATGAPLPRVHPMRSLWWLPVFVAALGGEWWLRRRRGDR